MAQNINQGIEDLVNAINDLIAQQAECGTVGGRALEPDVSDGEVSVGNGEQFPDTDSYFDAKCQAANWLYDGVLSDVVWFDSFNVDLIIGGGAGLMSAWITAQLLSGPPGWVATLAEATILTVVTLVVTVAINFQDVNDALADKHDEIVAAVYNASNAATARASFLSILDGATPDITAIELKFVGLLLSSNRLNQLFTPSNDVLSYTSPDPVTCGSTITVWTFDSNNGGWSFDAALSAPTCSATWSDTADAWILEVQGPGTVWSVIKITGLSIAVAPGNSFQFDFGPPSTGLNTSFLARVIYADTSEFTSYGDTTGAGTRILSITESGTISELRIEVGRQTGGDTTSYDNPIHEARVQ